MRDRTVPVCVVLFLLVAPALAQAQARGQAPVDPPSTTLVPEMDFEKAPFDDVMAFMRKAMPGFQVQVLRDPNVPDDYPRVTLKAKNVSLHQALDYFKNAYDIEWREIIGEKGPIFMIRIKYTQRLQDESQLKSNEQHFQRMQAPQSKLVRVYPLSAVAPATKDPLADVLSLVQAAIEQAGVPPPALKLHEPTRALLATGEEQSLAVIDNVLNALKPAQDDLRRQYEAKLQEAEQVLRLRQVEFEGKLRMMEVQRAQLEQAMHAQQAALQQAAKAEQEELRALVRKLEVELSATRARGAQP